MKKLIFILLALCLTGTACEDKEPDVPASLTNTKWKLAGIVDARTGTLKELEPKECKECYTISFNTDSTLLGYSTSNMMNGKYIVDYETQTIYMIYGTATFVGEKGDGYLYIEVFPSSPSVLSFSLKENELRLYYNNKKNYLQFKLQ